jgi:Bacterial PH domain/Domain of unknown function (DUF1648)
MEWLTDKRTGTQTGLLFIIGLVVLDIFCLVAMTTRPIGPLTFILALIVLGSIPVLALIGYQLYGLARSGYDVDRNAVTIQWGPVKQIVPVESIQRIMLGTEVEGGVKGFHGWRWPGLMQGQGELPEADLTVFYASTSLPQQLILVTSSVSYAISPADAAGFIESIKARYELGPTQAVEQTTEHPAFFGWPLWSDRVAHYLLITGATMCLLLFGLVSLRIPNLPPVLPLHYNVLGLPDRAGPATQVFILPLIGLLALGANTLLGGLFYRREQMASYLLWGGIIVVQVLLWIATVNLLRV